MTLEFAFNLVWGVVLVVVGLLYKNLLERLKQTDDALNKLSNHLSIIMTDYVSRQEVSHSLNRIERKLERIEDKLERKADKQ